MSTASLVESDIEAKPTSTGLSKFIVNKDCFWRGRGGWEGFGIFESVEYFELFFPWRSRGNCWNQNGEQTHFLRIAEDARETKIHQRAGLGSARCSHYNPSGYSGGCPAGHCHIYSVEKIKGLWRQVKWAPWTWNLPLKNVWPDCPQEFGCDFFFCVFIVYVFNDPTFLTLLSMFHVLSVINITMGKMSGASEP